MVILNLLGIVDTILLEQAGQVSIGIRAVVLGPLRGQVNRRMFPASQRRRVVLVFSVRNNPSKSQTGTFMVSGTDQHSVVVVVDPFLEVVNNLVVHDDLM
jgi:hypothetical protein